METPIQEVRRLLDTLPQEASFEDIQYHIYVRQKIQQGMDDLEAGRVVSHEEVQQRFAKWLTPDLPSLR
jgi:predicted transcriptional regulator